MYGRNLAVQSFRLDLSFILRRHSTSALLYLRPALCFFVILLLAYFWLSYTISNLCDECRKFFDLWGKLQKLGFKGIANSVRDIKDIFLQYEEGCELCSIIRVYVPEEIKAIRNGNEKLQPFRLSIDLKGVEIGGVGLYVIKFELGVRLIEICVIPILDRFCSQSIIKRSAVSRRNDSELSLHLAASWHATCVTEHECHSMSQKAFPTRILPTRLICLRDPDRPYLCLTAELSAEIQYATLGHCWGSIVQFKLTKLNIMALRKCIPVEEVSKTFQHAFFLAKRFGFDYLWIDSLCIVQDDETDWQFESSTMASVYGCSSLNLAASYARDGIFSCFVERNPEDVVPCQALIDHQTHKQIFACVPVDFYRRGLLATALGQRAWAFQERFLAPRTLYFSEFQIFWGCQQLEACESFPRGMPPAVCMDINFLPHDNGLAHNPTMRDLIMNRPGIWSDIVLHYSTSLLTRPEDKLIAISGVARLMQQANGSMYLAGLWRGNIEWQLLWSVNSAPMDTRKSSSKSPESLAYRAPSWSWASVDGVIRQLFPDPTPDGTEGHQLCIEVTAAFVKPLRPHDDLGGISGAWLRIASCGPLKTRRDTLDFRRGIITVLFREFDIEQEMKMTAIWDRPIELHEKLFYLPVWTDRGSFRRSSKYRFGGLILVCSNLIGFHSILLGDSIPRSANVQDVYQRVGQAVRDHSGEVETSLGREVWGEHQHDPGEEKPSVIFLV